MRAFVDAKEFSAALELVSKVIRRSQYSIIEQIQVTISGGRCTLAATSLDRWLTKEIPARGDDMAFIFRRTKDVIRACHFFDGELSLETVETGGEKNRYVEVILRCGRRAGEFEGDLPEQFPKMPAAEGEVCATFNAAALLERIDRVSYAAMEHIEDRNPLRSSIQFDGNQVYALDGVRAACDAGEAVPFPKPIAMPVASLRLLKVFGNSNVEFRQWKGMAQFSNGCTTLFTWITLEKLFDLASVLPSQSTEEFYVYPKEFLRELKYLKEIGPDPRKPYVRFCGGQLLMSANGRKHLTAVDLDGESKIVFGFDMRWMADAMSQFAKESRIKMKVVSERSPIILEAEGRSDYALVLPIRLRQDMAA